MLSEFHDFDTLEIAKQINDSKLSISAKTQNINKILRSFITTPKKRLYALYRNALCLIGMQFKSYFGPPQWLIHLTLKNDKYPQNHLVAMPTYMQGESPNQTQNLRILLINIDFLQNIFFLYVLLFLF